VNTLYKKAILKKVIGKGVHMAAGEAATRSMQKIPIAGMFVGETKAQRLARVGGGTLATAGGGVSKMRAARKGNVSAKKGFGTNSAPTAPVVKELTASLKETHSDMKELEKIANRRGRPSYGQSSRGSVAPGLGQIMGGTLATAGAGAIIVGGIHGANKLYQKVETERIWNRLKKEYPDLTRSRQDRENFEVLQRFSPDIAGNITTARSYLQRAQQTHMAPHEFVKDLASVQETRGKGGLSRSLEGITNQSLSAGVDFAKRGSSNQYQGLINSMNSVLDN